LRHDLNSYPVMAGLQLAHCKLCGKVWRTPHSRDDFESFSFEWLGVVVPSGWTFANEAAVGFQLDCIQELSIAEALLWCAEPCTGEPRDKHPGLLENSIYRLMALDLVDWRTRGLNNDCAIVRAARSWKIPPWAPMIPVSSLRAQHRDAAIIPAVASAAGCPR
jgi:hypothetical protein